MAYFTEDQAAELIKTTVRVATLVDLEFADNPVYLWNGFGSRLIGGKLYLGAGDLGNIEGLEDTRGAISQQVTFTLSGVPDSPSGILAEALGDAGNIQGKHAIVSLQFFDEDWSALFDPIPIYLGIMQGPRIARDAATETQGARRTVILPTENAFYARHRPSSGRYTDAEQQKRFPGDRFCRYTPKLANLTLVWPDY